MIKVLLTDTLNPKAIELLNEIPEFEAIVRSGLTERELKSEIKHYEALVVDGTTIINKEILENADHLKIIVRTGIGLENIDVAAAAKRNIDVKDTPLATVITAAEYTLAQMLGVCRTIAPAYASMKAHKWEKDVFSKGMELYGKTAGIIGMGRVGMELAKRLLALGMKVLYYDICDIQTDSDARQTSFDQLLRKSDIISIHLPLNDSTRNLIATDAFKKMKPGTILVNVSSGGIVDEAALAKAFEKGKIKAAALDVFEHEPPQNFDLIDNEKIFPSPHLCTSTVEAQERAELEAISILKEFFNA
ncbi:MAG: hydroxyacid dehydrogenase [Candidatus Omnitrophota bacterium]